MSLSHFSIRIVLASWNELGSVSSSSSVSVCQYKKICTISLTLTPLHTNLYSLRDLPSSPMVKILPPLQGVCVWFPVRGSWEPMCLVKHKTQNIQKKKKQYYNKFYRNFKYGPHKQILKKVQLNTYYIGICSDLFNVYWYIFPILKELNPFSVLSGTWTVLYFSFNLGYSYLHWVIPISPLYRWVAYMNWGSLYMPLFPLMP